MTMVKSLLDPNIGEGAVPVVLICPRRSPLRILVAEPGALAVLDTPDDSYKFEEIVASQRRYVVVVDDAELLDATPFDDVLVSVLRQSRDAEQAVIVGGTTQDLARGYSGFIADTRRSRTGILLAVRSPDDGDLFNLRLPRDVSVEGPTGRGLFVQLGQTTPLQCALSATGAG
jgi:S-DNA-T family DNA segregation ATPase FtsK/SpoIIIE